MALVNDVPHSTACSISRKLFSLPVYAKKLALSWVRVHTVQAPQAARYVNFVLHLSHPVSFYFPLLLSTLDWLLTHTIKININKPRRKREFMVFSVHIRPRGKLCFSTFIFNHWYYESTRVHMPIRANTRVAV